MAASTSRQPQDVPLPCSPDPPIKPGKKTTSRKGKGKENLTHESTNILLDDLASDSAWEWASLTDPAASKAPPIFTKDGSYFFSLVGSSVKVHSVATGSAVSTLSSPEGNGTPSALLTCAILNPNNAFQLVTGSLDGRLMVWDFLDATLLKVIDIAQPIHHVCAHADFKDSIFVAATRSTRKTKTSTTDTNAVVLRVSLRTAGNTTKSAEIQPIGKTRFPTGLTFSPSGAWLIATAGNKVYVAMSSSFTLGFTKYVSPERLTCLAFHPSEEYFATGDVKGTIRIWYCLNESMPVNVRGVEKKTQTTTLHWHAHAVSSIAFTPNGAYLLSGGEESVLVIWQLRTGQKEFVPRVGAPINTISVSRMGSGDEEYLLGLADATYLFVSSATLRISRSYSRIKLDPTVPCNQPSTSTRTVPLAVHTPTSSLILPSSHPSSLQVYSPFTSKLIYELEVSPSNKVSRRDERPPEPCYIEHTSISSSGDWLASVDCRDRDDGIRGESYLKIWRWDRKIDQWILNTRIDRPHGLQKVTCLAFSPAPRERQSIRLVSTGEDGDVKIWGLRAVKDRSEPTEEFWVVRSAFSFRSKIPRSASWSTDGSLLAISIGPFIAIYDPVTNSLCETFTSPECRATTSAHFVGKGGRYLVGVGDHDLVLWDVVALCVRWHYRTLLTISHVVAHPQEDSFAVFLSHALNTQHQKARTRALIFRPTSSSPSSTHSLPFFLRNLSLYTLSHAPSMYTFVGITRDWNVILFGEETRLNEEGSTAKEISVISLPSRRSLFQDIFGKSAFADSQVAPALPVENPTHCWTGKEALDAFDSPAYLMPPLGSLYDPVMDGFLKPRPETVHNGSMGTGDEDVEMDEEDVEAVFADTRRRRMVSREEVDTFIQLFRKHSIQSSPQPNANGHLEATRKGKTNSIRPIVAPAASTPMHGSVNQVKPIRTDEARSLSSAAMAVNGRKRKKTSS